MEPAQRAEMTAEIKAMVRATVFLVRMGLRRFDEVLEMEGDRAAEDVDIESSKGRPVRWCGEGWDMMAAFDPRRTAKSSPGMVGFIDENLSSKFPYLFGSGDNIVWILIWGLSNFPQFNVVELTLALCLVTQ